MNTRGLTRHPLSILLIAACAAFPLLLSACQTDTTPTSLPTVEPTAIVLPTQPSTNTPEVLPTQPPAEATQPPASTTGDITLDLSGVAQDQSVETVEAVPASAGGPWWEVLPQYRRVTLQGYPVTGHSMEPQIFIYPAGDLASDNETAGKIAADLQALLETQQAGEDLPFLPLNSDVQAMHAQVQYLDFKNGSGVRYLTQFNQGLVRINNVQLIYTFQGLTSDGQFYVAAVLPVTHPDLPAAAQVFAQSEAELSEYPAYLADTAAWLDQQPSGSFTADLAKLDALIQSIEVK